MLHITKGKISQAQAERKCNSLQDCAAFSWNAKAGRGAIFCRKLPTTGHGGALRLAKTAEGANGWKTAVRKHTRKMRESLMEASDIKSFVKLGLLITMPKLFKRLFRMHGALYGFDFVPTVKKGKDKEFWLYLHVAPTKRGTAEVDDKMVHSIMRAVKHVSILNTKGRAVQWGASNDLKISSSVKEVVKAQADSIIKSMKGTTKAITSQFVHSQKNLQQHHTPSRALLGKGTKKLLKKLEKSKKAQHIKKKTVDVLRKAIAEVKRRTQAGVSALQKVAAVLKKSPPKLKSINVSPIYLGCLYNPGSCKKEFLKHPTVHVCFTKVGCTKGKPVGVAALSAWIRTKAVKVMARWMRKALVYKKIVLKLPMTLRYTRSNRNAKRPSHLSLQAVGMQIPTHARSKVLDAMKHKKQEDAIHVVKPKLPKIEGHSMKKFLPPTPSIDYHGGWRL
jgi:hypothetical protein